MDAGKTPPLEVNNADLASLLRGDEASSPRPRLLLRAARIEEIAIGVADPALGDTCPSVALEVRHRNDCQITDALSQLRREFARWNYSNDTGQRYDPRRDKERPLDEVLLHLIAILGARLICICRERCLTPPYELRIERGPWRFVLPLPS